tara:strand:- start:44 stop:331 length:288 start_codon:yes stop_codon:yes gene_type:complete
MKITKSQLRQIIKEELSSLDESANEFTNYLLKMYQDLSETGDVATIREIIVEEFSSALKAAEDVFLGDEEEPPWTDPEVDPEADQAWWAHQLKDR